MITDHRFRPYTDIPEMCIAELASSGDTCNGSVEDHADVDADVREFFQSRGLTDEEPNSAGSDYLCSRCGAFGENGEYTTDDHGEEFCLDCYEAKKELKRGGWWLMKHWDDAVVAACDNCSLYCAVSQLNPIDDLDQRLDVGGVVPAGQCPSCGALSYLTPEDPAGGAT